MRAHVLVSFATAAAGLIALTACAGGDGATPAAFSAASSQTASSPRDPRSAGAATVTFRVPLPGSARAPVRRLPRYVGKTTVDILVEITGGPGGGTTYPRLVLKKTCTAAGCSFDGTDSLPVQRYPYTFAFTAHGVHGTLSQGTVVQTLVRGSNSIDVALSAVVASAGIAVPKASPVPGGPATQSFAVKVSAVDADGNAITGDDPFAQPIPVSVFEVDNQAAFVLTAATGGSADCTEFPGVSCNVRSNADAIALRYDGQANDFPADPQYYPAEAIVYNGNPNSVGNLKIAAGVSADVSTPRCVKPAPICVYARPYYPLLLGGLNPTATGVIFPATFVAANGSTIWTDVGTIDTSGAAPAFVFNAAAYGQQLSGGLQFSSARAEAFTIDYGGGTPRLIDAVARAGAVTAFAYPPDTANASSPQGGGIIAGPDGNLWWIDPATASLRVASPASPGTAKVCGLAPAGASQVLSAAQIVATPAGVAPTRVWFSAVDDVTGQSYVGYVNASAGSNSCGHATYVDIDAGASGTPPNGLAVDKNGNAWYDDANASFTAIGEVRASAGGTLTAPAPVSLPAAFSGQAWGVLLDPADGYLYFLDDDGVLGRFDPAKGPGSATGFPLPGPLANTLDLVSGTSFNSTGGDGSCPAVLPRLSGPCFQQFAWDAGSGGRGRLTFVIPGTEFTFGSPSNAPSEAVVTAIDLNSSVVKFESATRDRGRAAYAHGISMRRPSRPLQPWPTSHFRGLP